VLIAAPWIAFFIFFVIAILSITSSSDVQPNDHRLFCHLTIKTLSYIVIVTAGCAGLILYPTEIRTGIILYRNWKAFRSLSRDNSRISLSMFIRLIVMTFLTCLGMGMAAINLPGLGGAGWSDSKNIVLITAPILTAIAFGTQRDIMGAWIFCRRKKIPQATRTDRDQYVNMRRVLV